MVERSIRVREKILENPFDPLRHFGVISRLIVSVSYQVKRAVNEEVEDHLIRRVTQFERVLVDPVRAYDDIPEEIIVRTGSFAFILGERKDVGGLTFPPKSAIEFGHFFSVYN